MIGRFRSILFVSVFHGSFTIATIMIYGSLLTGSRVGCPRAKRAGPEGEYGGREPVDRPRSSAPFATCLKIAVCGLVGAICQSTLVRVQTASGSGAEREMCLQSAAALSILAHTNTSI